MLSVVIVMHAGSLPRVCWAELIMLAYFYTALQCGDISPYINPEYQSMDNPLNIFCAYRHEQ